MFSWIKTCLPEEACGILGGCGEEVRLAIPVENELHSPNQFRMQPEAQLKAFLHLEEQGLDLLAIWHSHPSGPSGLSPSDLVQAYYPEAALLVWSPAGASEWQLRGFFITQGKGEEILLVDE
jgi:proteasome lid subunit RPN8/RPN11